MRKLIILLLLVSPVFIAAQQTVLFPGFTGKQLRDSLVFNYKSLFVWPYDIARDSLFGKVELHRDYVYCLYTGDSISINLSLPINPRTQADNLGFNTEHLYPQSKGAASGNGNSNLHHLFPVRSGVNSSRNNLPYCDVPDSLVSTWWRLNYSQTTIPDTLKNEYSKRSSIGFEVRDVYKGNAARGVFYFFTMYQNEAETSDPDFFNKQLPFIRRWHYVDPPDSLEYVRNNIVAEIQDNRYNPFIIDTTLVTRCYGVIPPSEFSIEVIDETHVTLRWIQNPSNDSVIIVRNQSGVLGEPLDGNVYSDMQFALNGIIRIPSADSLVDVLPTLGAFYYKIYSFTDSNTYSVGLLRFVSTGFTDAIHYWNFNNNVPPESGLWGNNIPAFTGTGMLVHGFPDVRAFQGSILNTLQVDEAGSSFCPRGTVNNDSCITLSVPTTNFKDIIFSYTTRGTSTGYSRQSIYYSTDGIIFDSLQSFVATSFDWTVRSIDFTTLTDVNDNPNFKIKIFVRGATSSLGNNRFDNFKITGNDKYLYTGAVDAPQTTLSLFPNPANQLVNLQLQGFSPQDASLQIFSSAGLLVLSKTLHVTSNNFIEHLGVNSLARGLYYLKLTGSSETIGKSFLIIK